MTIPRDARASSPGRVLVTDAEFKHTLGIARSLAARGHEVHVIARSSLAPSVHSRAVHRWHAAPSTSDPGFDDALLGVAASIAPASLIAVGSGSVAAADRVRDRLPAGVVLALPPRASLEIANDKARTAETARGAGVVTPREIVVSDVECARSAWDRLGSPMVLKSRREEGRKVVRYVRDASGIERAFVEVRALSPAGVLAQEYVRGDGFGFSALYWKGRRLRRFMHRRVREWPPTGGTSACAESVPDCPELERAGGALLDALEWNGVAMVEFKGSPAPGKLALMEINAKFWGSHDLALAAGVDFPGDLAALMEGRDLAPQAPYRRVRFSWPLGGDLWHGIFRPSSLPAVLADALSPRVAHTFRASDPLPHLYEAWQWARSTPGAWRELRDLR
jgi:predicted ATP-grasp superfamily ATP-dependent carboligase